MNRRAFLRTATAGSLALPLMSEHFMSEHSNRSSGKLGIATTSYMMAWKPKDTSEFLEHCHALGAGGVQCAINGDLPKIRARAEKLGMYIEAMVPMPKGNDTAAFEQALKDAQTVGAVALRSACLGTRRYESFDSLERWQEHVAESHKSIEAAKPVLDRYKLPLGLENHKDWTADELVALMKKYGSEYLGVCLDFGNNISLLDEPMDVIQKLAPYTVTTHLKDMAVDGSDDGFLLSEVLLGSGYLDLPHAVSAVRQARPQTRFSLEMITRDPLRVPCLDDKYWATFPDRSGLYLARTLRFVQQHQGQNALPRVSQLSHEDHVAKEDANVVACLKYAHENLGL
jgi:3-oxoisoapionate decarboxylase